MPMKPRTGRCIMKRWIHHSNTFDSAKAAGITRNSYPAGARSGGRRRDHAGADGEDQRDMCPAGIGAGDPGAKIRAERGLSAADRGGGHRILLMVLPAIIAQRGGRPNPGRSAPPWLSAPHSAPRRADPQHHHPGIARVQHHPVRPGQPAVRGHRQCFMSPRRRRCRRSRDLPGAGGVHDDSQ